MSDVDPITPGAQQISLCFYSAGDPDDEIHVAGGHLAVNGTVPANIVNDALAQLSENPASRCSDSPPHGMSAATPWLLVQPKPQRAPDDSPAPLLAIEADACRRGVDAQKMALLGYLSPAGTEALAAAAGRSAS